MTLDSQYNQVYHDILSKLTMPSGRQQWQADQLTRLQLCSGGKHVGRQYLCSGNKQNPPLPRIYFLIFLTKKTFKSRAQRVHLVQLQPPVSTRCAKVPSLVEFSWVVQLGISWSLCQVPDITHAIMWQLGSPFPENSKAWQKATNTLVLLWCWYCLLGNSHLVSRFNTWSMLVQIWCNRLTTCCAVSRQPPPSS